MEDFLLAPFTDLYIQGLFPGEKQIAPWKPKLELILTWQLDVEKWSLINLKPP